MKVGINEEGIKAERLGREFMLKRGIRNHQQLDWIYKHEGSYKIIEVKSRELFNPPPFSGTGLDIRQLDLRKQIYQDLGIDTTLLVFEKCTRNVYYQDISILMKGKYFDTRNKIRIFPIVNFNKEVW